MRPVTERSLPVQPNPTAEYIDAAELARRLNLSRSRIYSMAEEGEIPSLRFGRYLRFRWESVVERLNEIEVRDFSESPEQFPETKTTLQKGDHHGQDHSLNTRHG
jgi:excisionase family DNA binding protein